MYSITFSDPFSVTTVTKEFDGVCLDDAVRSEYTLAHNSYKVCYVDNSGLLDIPSSIAKKLRPKSGRYIAYVAPKDSDTARIALTIALVAAGQYYVVGAAGLGLTGTAAAIGSSLVTAGSVYLAQKIIPFEDTSVSPSATESSTYSLSGSSNQVSTGNIPYLIGTHKFSPPKAIQPITEAQGKDVYLTEVFCAGYGPLRFDDSSIKIGETHYSNFEDLQIQIKDNLNYSAPIDLVSGDTFSESLSINFEEALDESIRTTQTDCEEIVVELAWPSLVRYDDKGRRQSTSVSYDIFYAPTGSGDYTSFKGTSANIDNISFHTTIDRLEVYPNDGNGSRSKAIRSGIKSFITFVDGIPSGYSVGTSFSVRDSDKNNRTFNIYKINGNTAMVGYYEVGQPYVFRDSERSGPYYKQKINQIGTQVQNESGTDASIFISTGTGVSFTSTDSTATTTYRTHSINVPKGQYDVRIIRKTPKPSDTKTSNQFTWTQLKSIQYTNEDGSQIKSFPEEYCYIAIKVKATDQLNGSITNLNCIASSVCNSYDADLEKYNDDDRSGNPAWEYFKILTSQASKKPLEPTGVEISDFEEWAELCDEQVLSTEGDLEPRFRVSIYVDYETSAEDLLKKIATIGRAASRRVDFKEGVLVDKKDKPSVINLSPANVTSLTWSKSFSRNPDAFKVSYADADNDYTMTDQLVKVDDSVIDSDLGFIESLDGTGITDSDQIYRFGKYAHAQLRQRPKEYELKLGINYLTFLRGDVITLTHDRVQGVTCHGQVLGVSGNIVTVDNPFNISNADLPLYGTFSNPESDSQSIATYEVTDIDGNEITFDSLPAFDMVDGYYSIGSDTSSLTKQFLVSSIKTANDITATVSLVDYGSPAIFEAEDKVSDYTPIARPIKISQSIPPSDPVITEVVTNERALLINSDGSIQTRAEISLSEPDENKPSPEYVRIFWRLSASEGIYEKQDYLVSDRYFANDLIDGESYDIKAMYISEYGVASGQATSEGVLVEGKTNVPLDVTGFYYEIQEGRILLYWNANTEIDVKDYEIRVGSDWSNSTLVDVIRATEKPIELLASGSHNYMIKAIDIIGLESENASELTVSMPYPDNVSGGSFSIIEDGYNLLWDAYIGLNFSQFEVREGDLWNSATVIAKIKSTQIKFPVRSSGSYKYLIKAIDSFGNYSLSSHEVLVEINNPVGVVGFGYRQVSDGIEIEWQQNTNLWHSQYEVRRGVSWEDSIKVDILKTNTKKVGVLSEGSYSYRIKSIDLAGNYSDESVFTVSVNPPSQVVGISAETIDNNINLRWAEPSYGFKIDYYKIYKLNTQIGGFEDEIGYTYTTFFTRFESDAGTYLYSIEPVDIAGNVGVRGSIEAVLDVPPDYVLVDDDIIDLSDSTDVNGIKYKNAEVTADSDQITADSTLYTADSDLTTDIQFIVDVNRTYGEVQGLYNVDENASSTLITADNNILTADINSTETIQSLNDSGIQYWNQLAGATTGSFEYTMDYGSIVDSSNVRVTDVWDDLIGTVNKSYTISQSLDGVSWTDYSGKTKFMRNFRYVKILIDLTSDGNSLSTLDSVRFKLDLKKRYDGGSDEVTDSVNGKTVEFNQSFVDVSSITVTPNTDGTLKHAIYDFDNAGDQDFFIVYLYDASGNKTTGDFGWAAEGF